MTTYLLLLLAWLVLCVAVMSSCGSSLAQSTGIKGNGCGGNICGSVGPTHGECSPSYYGVCP